MARVGLGRFALIVVLFILLASIGAFLVRLSS